MDENSQMMEFMSLQALAQSAGHPGMIFMEHEGSGFTLLLKGKELEQENKAGFLRQEPVMLSLSALPGSGEGAKEARLLSITQTVRFPKEMEEKTASCIETWQNQVLSSGVLLDAEQGTLLLKAAFPLPHGTDALSPDVLGHAIHSFRQEAGTLYEMLTREPFEPTTQTGGETA